METPLPKGEDIKYVMKKRKACRLMADDHIKVGGRMLRITDIDPTGGYRDRTHIRAFPLDAIGSLPEAISLFVNPMTKLKVYTPK